MGWWEDFQAADPDRAEVVLAEAEAAGNVTGGQVIPGTNIRQEGTGRGSA